MTTDHIATRRAELTQQRDELIANGNRLTVAIQQTRDEINKRVGALAALEMLEADLKAGREPGAQEPTESDAEAATGIAA